MVNVIQSVVMDHLALNVLESVTVWMMLSVTRRLGNALTINVQQDGRARTVKQVHVGLGPLLLIILMFTK